MYFSFVEVDLRNQVDTCISMAANNSNYSTVVACSQLAQQFWEHAREHTHVCEKLVHDQHLQQQVTPPSLFFYIHTIFLGRVGANVSLVNTFKL